MKTISKISLVLLCAAVSGGSRASVAQEASVSARLKTFRGVAKLQELSVNEKRRSASVHYPVFQRKTPLLRFINADIGNETRTDFARWREETRTYSGDLPVVFDVAPELVFYRPQKVVSLRQDVYQFNGGAHGLGVSLFSNFGIVNGRPKRLVLGDFFLAGTAYRPSVESKILAKLRKNPSAEWLKDGSVKSLTTEQFNNFGIGKNGLTWIFNPYEMGPYAVGQFDVTLSPAELGAGFRRDWLR